MNDNTYNGWENRETWGVALIIDNDEKLYNKINLDAAEAGRTTASFAIFLKDWIEDSSPIDTSKADIYADLLGVALNRVNWYELAKHYTPDNGWTPAVDHSADHALAGSEVLVTHGYAAGTVTKIKNYNEEKDRFALVNAHRFGDFDRGEFVIVNRDTCGDYYWWMDQEWTPIVIEGLDDEAETKEESDAIKADYNADGLIDLPFTLRALVLAKFLNCTPNELIQARRDDNTYSLGHREYMILTDYEANQLWDQELDNYLDECVLAEMDGVAANYFDRDAWKRDARMDGRGHSLNRYDGSEEEAHCTDDNLRAWAVELLAEDYGVNAENANNLLFEGDEQFTAGATDIDGNWLCIYRQN